MHTIKSLWWIKRQQTDKSPLFSSPDPPSVDTSLIQMQRTLQERWQMACQAINLFINFCVLAITIKQESQPCNMSIYRDHDSPLPVHLVPNFKAFIGSYLNTKSNKFLIHMQHKGFTIIICTVVHVGLCYSVFNSWANKQRNTQKT